jgi:glycosyltransferase involved in cell wall biosynthesis
LPDTLKICHLSSVHSRYDVRIFHKECISLSKFYELCLVVADGKGDEIINGISIIDAGVRERSRIKRIINTAKKTYKKALEQNAHIYHFHDPELLPYGLKLKNKGYKVIYDIHEDVPRQILAKYWIPTPLRKLTSMLFEKYENRIAKKLSALVTATPTINRRFIKLNEWTVNINNFPFLPQQKHIKNSKSDAYICYVGGISHIRGISYLVESLQYMPHIRLKLAGSYIPETYRNQLISLKGWNQVDEMGYINREEIMLLIANSLAGIVTLLPTPNYIDSLPVKMFEYMSASVPVIASNFTLWQQIIEQNKCGICVNPEDPKQIAIAVLQLYNKPDLANEMGTNGYKAVCKTYNWQVEENKLVQLYSSLANA